MARPDEDIPDTQADVVDDEGIWDKFMSKIRNRPREGKHRYILPNHMAYDDNINESDKERLQMQKRYLDNYIRTTKYTVLSFLPKNLFEQFHRFANCYFVFIILLNFIPAIEAIAPLISMIPVIMILLVQAIKDIIEDYGRYKSDKLVNNSKTEVFKSSDDKYHTIDWKDVRVGDLVRLYCNGVIPADILLLHTSDENGNCFIETSNIDGETNLKQRTVCKGVSNFRPREFRSLIQCEKPNSELNKFHGNIITPRLCKESVGKENLLLRGCMIRNTDYIEGIVVYAGHETKAMLNNNGPRYKRSKLEKRMNVDVLWCVVLLFIMCITGAIGNGVWASYQAGRNQTEIFIPPTADNDTLSPALSGFYMFWTMIILLQVIIPISLYVSIEIVKVGQVYFINNDLEMYDADSDKPLECRALNITEDLGQVEYLFSDKTGTLTENSMVFRRCNIGGVDYPHAANAARIENREHPNPDQNPADHRKHSARRTKSEAYGLNRDDEIRASYRRLQSGSIRAHHRNHSMSTHRVQVPGSTSSAPNSPEMPRSQIPRSKPHKHHRRNISSISAKEIAANLANGSRNNLQEREIFMKSDEDEDDYIEVDVTPDPVLYKELRSSGNDVLNLSADIDKRRILDFFINLAVCNTVVLSSNDKNHKIPKANGILPNSTEKFRRIDSHADISSISGKIQGSGKSSIDSNSAASIASTSGDSFSSKHLKSINYEAESPDEAALVYAAHAYGLSLAKRDKDTVTVALPKENTSITFQVLHTLTFDSIRKRMSVILKDLTNDKYIVYCKGADSVILPLLKDPNSTDADYHGSNSTWFNSYRQSNTNEMKQKTVKMLDRYARDGLRTLCITKRVLTEEEYRRWAEGHRDAEQSLEDRDQKVFESYLKIEKDLELLGSTGVEDRLQDGVPETIEALRKAGMQVWVITGDKQETAVNIGYSCNLFSQQDEVIYLNTESQEEMRAHLKLVNEDMERVRGRLEETVDPEASFLSLNSLLRQFSNEGRSPPRSSQGDHPPLSVVIDGKSLEFAMSKELQKAFIHLARRCHSVLVCRATPLQKGEIVKLVKDELRVMTLAIGDGANDVSMIQVADIGVGISGQEGMQAVMSSDFAMSRFKFLQRLLLVHGHWNYARLAMMVLYFFYKNAAFVFLIFWYQFFCGYSGANPIEQMYLLLYSLIFTSVPPLINGVLDKDLHPGTLLRKPRLYMQGINCELYRPWSFWINILDAIYQSVAIFFIPYFTYLDTDIGVVSWGTPVTTACMFANLIHLGIETKTWTWIHWAGQLGSIAVFFAFSFIYNAICAACFPPSNPYWIMETLVQTSNFWFSIMLATVIAVLPRYIIRALQSTLWPSECQRERALESMLRHKREDDPFHDASVSTSSTYQNDSYESPTKTVPAVNHRREYVAEDQLLTSTSRNTNQNNIWGTNISQPTFQPMSSDKIAVGLENPAYEGDNRDVETFPSAEIISQDCSRESETGEVLGPCSPINAGRDFFANEESSEENILAQLNPEPVILPTTTSENSSIDINNTVT